MDKWFIGFAIAVIVLLVVVSVFGAGYFGLQEQLNQQQDEKQAEILLKEQADANAMNFQAGTMNAINAINNQFLENEGKVVLPIFNKETNAFVDVPFLTEEKCGQIPQQIEEN